MKRVSMIAIILAGGYGTRLWPLTKRIAKPLLLVKDRPIIDYIVDRLLKLEVSEIIITTNRKFEGQFRRWLRQRKLKNAKLCVEPSCREEEKLGAVKAISRLVSEVRSNDIMVVAGDNLFSSDLKGFVDYYKERGSPVIAVYDVGSSQLAKKYSTVQLDESGRVLAFEEKPRKPRTSLVGTCIYIFPKKSLEKIFDYLKERKAVDAFGCFTEWLVEREEIYGYVLSGHWFDIGTLDSYERAKKAFETHAYK